MLTRKNKLLLYKLLSLFSVVRGYNILMIALAQYLASIFILSPDLPLMQVVLDINLFLIVLLIFFVNFIAEACQFQHSRDYKPKFHQSVYSYVLIIYSNR